MTAKAEGTIIDGRVVMFNLRRGFGFLRADEMADEVYFSLDDVPGRPKKLRVGSRLRGQVVTTKKGLKLSDIEILCLRSTDPYKFFGWGAVSIALAFAVILILTFNLELLGGFFIAINATALFFMGLDKMLARSNSLRTPELVIFALAFLGGSPGVLLGTRVFRHKTRKANFQLVLLLIMAAQAVVLAQYGIQFRIR